jgi:DNA-binding response OmpR family regulator
MSKKVLIVDDEVSLNKALSEKFSKEGLEVVSAKNGTEALDALKKESYSAVVLDLVMPIMHGLEFLEEVKKHENLSKIPVFVLTSLPTDSMELSVEEHPQIQGIWRKADLKLKKFVKEVKSTIA